MVKRASSEQTAGVLVVFGITGDLARVMTFRQGNRCASSRFHCPPRIASSSSEWSVVSSDEGNVLAQSASNAGSVFNVVLVDDTNAKDVDISVKLKRNRKRSGDEVIADARAKIRAAEPVLDIEIAREHRLSVLHHVDVRRAAELGGEDA